MHTFLRTLLLTIPLIAASACTAVLPNVGALKTQYPVVHYNGPKTPPVVTLEKQRPPGWVSLDAIPKSVVGAIVVSEDYGFYQHNGVDIGEFKEALKENIEAGRFKRGGSTITQQVVKNVFLTSDKTIVRKLKEMFLAGRLEQAIGKKKVLETYFNIAEWGAGVFGIGAASQTYFKKPPLELSPKEAAFLAMLLPSPKRYSQSFRMKKLTKYAGKTIDRILEKMEHAHYITDIERAELRRHPLAFELAADPAFTTPEGGIPTEAPEGDEESAGPDDDELEI